MVKQSVRVITWAIVAMGSTGTTLGAQAPEKRARPQTHIPVRKEETRVRPQTHIPVRKEETPLPAAAAPVIMGTKTEVVPPPVITNVVTAVPGTNTVISQTAPGIGARPLPWWPLLGLLGGAALLGTRHHGEETPQETTTTTPPPEIPPVVPPVTTVPEPTTVAMFATGLVGLALAMRRKRTR